MPPRYCPNCAEPFDPSEVVKVGIHYDPLYECHCTCCYWQGDITSVSTAEVLEEDDV